jgi:hypothetical protein
VKKSSEPARKKVKSTLKKVVAKNNNGRQLKMDTFVVKKKAKTPSPAKTPSQNNKNSSSDLGKRSTTLQAKNYRYMYCMFLLEYSVTFS